MTASTPPLWTIQELATQVSLALAENYDGQRNGQICDVPNVRTIRYYTTLGLLDRAAEMRGRTALYSTRHLLQLVAIKRLQAKGYGFPDIQQKLLGITDAALRKLANVPETFWQDNSPEKNSRQSEKVDSERTRDFWRQPPAPVPEKEESQPAPAALVQGVRVHEAVTMLLETLRPLEEDDIEAIRAAAAPLVKLLEKRRLIER